MSIVLYNNKSITQQNKKLNEKKATIDIESLIKL